MAAKSKCPKCGEMQFLNGPQFCVACRRRELDQSMPSVGMPAVEGFMHQTIAEAQGALAGDKEALRETAAAGEFAINRIERLTDEPFDREPVTQLIEGEPCPTCGKMVGRRTAKNARSRSRS